jgi:hypothetical protein
MQNPRGVFVSAMGKGFEVIKMLGRDFVRKNK